MAASLIKLPAELRREFLSALQALRPGSVAEELTEDVCISILNDRTRPSLSRMQSTGGTGRPKSAGAVHDGVDAAGGVSENEWRLMQRAKVLEEELRLALCSAEDIRALKAKAGHLLEEVRRGKEALVAEASRTKSADHRNRMLQDHAEKLMILVHNLSQDKVRMARARKEERLLCFKLTHELAVKTRKHETSKRLCVELQTAGRLLTKQLDLMTQKYRELRGRFDAARSQQNGAFERATKEASSLRKKFAAITRGKGRLDDVALPGDSFMDDSLTNFNTGFASSSPGRGNQHTGHGVRGDEPARPATTGGIGRSSTKRPSSAAPAHRPKTPVSQAAAEEEDLDKIIGKIWEKQRNQTGGRWTPDKLRNLVVDASGRVGCAIPDLAPSGSTSSQRGEPMYSKISM